MIEKTGEYYLYRHIRLDTNQPFYIGIGTKGKHNTHYNEYTRAYNTITRSNFWKKVVDKSNYEVEILLESDDYDFLKQKEIEFISLYGRRDLNKGSLTNMTDGGEGVKGRIVSDEEKEIMRATAIKNFRGVPLTEQHKQRIGDAHRGELNHNYGKKPSQEVINKIRESLSGANSYASKKVINTQTLIVYDSIKIASEKENINYSTLRSYLNGGLNNKSHLIIYNEEK